MPRTIETRSILRRACQGIFLVAFLLLLFWMTPPRPGTPQLAFEPTFQRAPVYLLCLTDPLASLTAFVAARVVSLLMIVPLVVVAISLVFPRVFCSHVCPLGTLIDVAGACRGRRQGASIRVLRFVRYALLAGALVFALFALNWAWFVTPMPILTRALRAGIRPAEHATDWLAPAALAGILLLSLVRKRFWCNVLCPTGALLSLVSRFSLMKRVRTDACISCGKCPPACDFDAIDTHDFKTTSDCTYCGACRPVCPVDAIEYRSALKPIPMRPSRRDFVAGGIMTAGLVAGGFLVTSRKTQAHLRPPGALDEDAFLGTCVRCGLCADACPGPAIHLLGISSGIETYSTPFINPLVAGCSPACNNCGRVCPTGAIAHNPLDVKNRIIMGTARHLEGVCRPWVGDNSCPRYCEMECSAAGHHAILQGDVPTVDPEKCVGCGLCVKACIEGNRKQAYPLRRPAVTVDPAGRQRFMNPDVRKKPEMEIDVIILPEE